MIIKIIGNNNYTYQATSIDSDPDSGTWSIVTNDESDNLIELDYSCSDSPEISICHYENNIGEQISQEFLFSELICDEGIKSVKLFTDNLVLMSEWTKEGIKEHF